MNYYGQFGDDKIIESFFEKDYIGGCIDVGASNGISINNTKHFEELGWYCLCIEPNPKYFEYLKYNRLHAINYAISNKNDKLPFNIIDLGNGCEDAISSLELDTRLVEKHKQLGYYINPKIVMVDVITLDYCIENFYKYDKIDFVSIDTEGTELDVLKGFSIEKWNPKLIVIENNFDDPDIEIYLNMYNYKKNKRIEVNDYYIKTI